ncbi:MAG TPA: TRAP transporter large permease subunit [Candidatus Methylomirabilis sp.]|nr:TRAP transporter large permease subunit [Candidatus Methylomirabilis sp.]
MGAIQEAGVTTPLAVASSAWGRPVVALSDAVDRACTFASVVATAGFAVIMLLGVFFRYALNDSLAWADEVALVVFNWAILLAIASGYLHDKHVNLDLLVRKLPAAWASRATVLAEGMSLGYLLSLTVSGIQVLPLASQMHTDALRWPLTIPCLAIPVACLIMDLHWMRRNLVSGIRSAAAVKLLIGGTFLFLVMLPIGQYVQLTGLLRAAVLIAALFGPMLIGVPVALSLGFMATFYIGAFGDAPFNVGAMQVYNGLNLLALMAIPLLILAGKLMHEAGMARHIVDFAQVLVGRIRGGLGAANVVASFLFGDISGSAVSDTAAIGSLMIPQMKARGYRADFCAALQGTAGTLGMMAPLAITILLYASATNASVSRLAAATILPAFLLAASFMLVTLVHARRYNYPREHVPRESILPRILRALPGLFALVLVGGGILGGIFTPAEVGAVLLGYVLLLSFFYGTAQPKRLYNAVVEAGYISGMTLFMASTSSFLGFVMTRDLVSQHVVEFVTQISTNRLTVIFLVSLVFIILGMILEPPAMIFGFLPSFMPLLGKVGVDVIYWGVLFCTNLGLGCIIPPVALNLFVSTQLAGVRYDEAVRASIPFIIIMMIDLAIMAIFPVIPLLLPHLLFDYPLPK